MGEGLRVVCVAADELVLRVPGDGDPVRLHHPLRGRLPPRPLLRLPKQRHRNQTGRLQVHHPTQASMGTKGGGYRLVCSVFSFLYPQVNIFSETVVDIFRLL